MTQPSRESWADDVVKAIISADIGNGAHVCVFVEGCASLQAERDGVGGPKRKKN